MMADMKKQASAAKDKRERKYEMHAVEATRELPEFYLRLDGTKCQVRGAVFG